MSVTQLRNFAIIGKMGAGKNEACDYLADAYGYAVFTLSTPIKRAAKCFWPTGEINRERGQALGRFIQEHDPEALVNAFKYDHITSDLNDSPVCVEAPRYPSDYEPLVALGYRVIEVWAPEEMRVDRLQRAGHGRLTDVSQLYDVSETALDDRKRYPRDWVIPNDAELKDLHNQIDNLIAKEDARV